MIQNKAVANALDGAADYIATYGHNTDGNYFNGAWRRNHDGIVDTDPRFTPPACVIGAISMAAGTFDLTGDAEDRLARYLRRSITEWSDETATPTVLTTLRTVAALTRQEA